METIKLQKPADRPQPNFRCILKLLLSAIFVLSMLGSSDLSAQFKEESVQMSYELRMNGEIHYARAMLNKLIDQGKEPGLAQYELARLKMASMKGGRNVEINSIVRSASEAVHADSTNVVYAYFLADCSFLKSYISLMEETESAKEDIYDAIGSLERVLELKADYHEVRMCLVEIYQQLPEDMGGDREKAAEHGQKLKEMDWFFGAQAGEILLTEETSRLEYWQEVWKNKKDDIRVQKQLGMAYLAEGNLEEAKPLFEEVMKEDPVYNTLMLDIARHHMYQVMWGRSEPEDEIPLAEAAIKEYLSLEPEPIAPLKAWAIGNLGKMQFFSGNEEEGHRLRAEAEAIDPDFSKASAVPGLNLYIPPGEIYRTGEYTSFLRPL